MTDNELSKIINGNSINVHIVNPPIENPWRTQGDYQQEQKEARERHELFQEQHQAVIRSHWAAIFAAAAAIITAIATCVLVYITAQSQTQLLEPTRSLPSPAATDHSKDPAK